MNNRRRWLLATLILALTLTTGCLGKREIDDLAMVMAVGLDPGDQPGHIRITAQIARPADVRGQTGAPTAGSGSPIWTVSGEGASIMEAIRSIARFSSRRVFWAHNQIVIINEKLARHGISEIVDFFSRNHELRMRTWMVVCSEDARQLVSLKTGLEVIPGVSLDKVFRYSQIVSEAPRTDMRTLSASYTSTSTHPVLARMRTRDKLINDGDKTDFGAKEQVELSGTAVFKRDKMVGWLSMEESRGLIWFVEPVESRVIVLPCPDDESRPTSLEVKSNKFEVTPHYEKGRISFDVQLDAKIDIVEIGCLTERSHSELMPQLEALADKQLAHEIQAVLKAAQKTYGVDCLELGKTFRNRYPAEWQRVSAQWGELFQNIEVRVHVRTDINSPVLLQKPMQPGK